VPSPDAGPDALYVRNVLLPELEPCEVLIAHELEGRSFKGLAVESGMKVNTLLSRKRSAVLHLPERLQNIHGEFTNK